MNIHPNPQVQARRWLVLPVLCISLFMVVVDNLIINVALPTLSRELGASTSGLQWIVDSYSLVFACLLLAFGALGDRLGRKGLIQFGMVAFVGCSVWASFAHSTSSLIIARGAMGVRARPHVWRCGSNGALRHRERCAAAVWSRAPDRRVDVARQLRRRGDRCRRQRARHRSSVVARGAQCGCRVVRLGHRLLRDDCGHRAVDRTHEARRGPATRLARRDVGSLAPRAGSEAVGHAEGRPRCAIRASQRRHHHDD